MTGETPTARQRRVWDGVAPSYDKQIAFFGRLQFGGGRQWVCSRASGRILEVAIGTGRNLPFYPAGTRITGIDLSPAMLAVARRRATELGIEALPFPDGGFDAVVCALSLCRIPRPAKAISEMARVLRPGGRLLLLDDIGSHHRPVRAVQRFVELFNARAGEYQTRRQLPLLAPIGLEVVESERLKWGTVERVAAVKP